jgi:replicative DNA helicase
MTPQNIEAEQAVLGAVLLSDEAVMPALLALGLEWEDFSRESHRLTFKAMTAMHQDRRHVDVLTLEAFLRSHGCLERAGGRAALDLLNSGTPDVSHYAEYGRIVRECAMFARLRKIAFGLEKATGRMDLRECKSLVSRAVALFPKDGPRAVENREAA